MVKLLEGPRKESRSKGTKALAAWVGTGGVTALFAYGVGLVAACVIGGIGGLMSLWLTWKWLKYRGEWGLKF